MSESRPWPEVHEAGRWATDLIEERLADTSQSPESLLSRAKELRKEATETEFEGFRQATLELADRYEAAAAARLTAN